MSNIKKRQLYFFLTLVAVLAGISSCNSKSDNDETEMAVTPAMVAVKHFYLQANDSVLDKLDSVFFSIDLANGVIFNADSLPVGTDVSRLVPSITFANTMTKAELTYRKEGNEQVTSNYLTNPNDTIDFSQTVLLDVTAQDGVSSFTYHIKVNVHKMEPDTIIWDRLANSSLPSRFENPVKQKTVVKDATVYTLIAENNGEFTLASTTDLFEGLWQKNALDFKDMQPEVESFTATPDAFYIVSQAGALYTSADATTWTDTGEEWISIFGAYGSDILGIGFNGDYYVHKQYPVPQDYEETPIADDFPISHTSALGVIETKWADSPIALLACGTTASGALSSEVWAFDGSKWAVINDSDLPELESPMLARYVVYRDTQSAFAKRAFDVWMLFGGINFSNEMNREMYISYDNGVHWIFAPESMQLPEDIPSLSGADIIVSFHDLTADISDAWKISDSTKSTRGYVIDGYDITWQCPYLYIIGGLLPDNALSSQIWRGVLARLTFTPLI